ncbi:hypothetical protein DOX54_18890, partial [Cronobacter sakazakii]|nr:hypothetical protein [Cronobacter sakazakii]EGT4368943.1 hypothetical protein [Cronobacter sakazakii]
MRLQRHKSHTNCLVQNKVEKLTDYSLEQQASILADYWLLLIYGISKWSYYQKPGRMGMYRGVDLLQDVPSLYQK